MLLQDPFLNFEANANAEVKCEQGLQVNIYSLGMLLLHLHVLRL